MSKKVIIHIFLADEAYSIAHTPPGVDGFGAT